MTDSSVSGKDNDDHGVIDTSKLPFYRQGNHWFSKRSLPSDIVIEVDRIFFHLHKFPLLSKCGKIARMVEESRTSGDVHLVLEGCPGGANAFILASQFCYRGRVDLSPGNAILAYCIADYLQMTEIFDEENLLVKTENFFYNVILRSWKDCILVLKSSEHLISQVENLEIVAKCLDALSMMACTDPSLFGWPMMMYGRLQSPGGSILWNGINTGARIRSSESDWWFEDVSCLNIRIFKRLITTMNKRGMRVESTVGAVVHYAKKYLPGLERWQSGRGVQNRTFENDQKIVLENIETLLPEKKGRSYCRFLLGLLRVSLILDVSQKCKESLERKIGIQLEFATLDGLLIPSFSNSENLYDTDSVERIIHHFSSTRTTEVTRFSPSSCDPVASPSSSAQQEVTKLIDNYLAEVAPDVYLKPQRMHSLMAALPESLRVLDDGLYRALDIYLEAHPWLTEHAKEQLCSVIDYGRLSVDARTHASHNKRLPLRFTVQVLFLEQLQLRSTLSRGLYLQGIDTRDDLAREIVQRDGWVSLIRENRVLKVDLSSLRSRVRNLEREFGNMKNELGRVRTSNAPTDTIKVPGRLGCMPISQSSESTHSNPLGIRLGPRKSVEQHSLSHSLSQK